MGIQGLFAQIGAGQRISLAKFSSDHYVQHERPLRLAIDISIWLFQIQSGKGGSNPALRTFYYRLLRLLTLNIWPLFVFDGPNKPLFKRNKKVGGPGVRVANVPEFLAKQLLKQFGFPWHVAPGEAEAECALLQREGIVDAVLSEDVDTLMFGSGCTLRNWTAENSSKTPTHVNVYHAEQTRESSGMCPDGMILVALMSGGDYLPEGIPGCGPKLACDAARAGFGRDLCAIPRKDATGIQAWKERLQHQIRTNEAKFFSRRNRNLIIPEDFPNLEVLGYYTHPCVSTPDKLARLRRDLTWDQPIAFPALRTFTADAFDWRCLAGAKKFVKNLAPAMLVRELRLCGDRGEGLEQDMQEEQEKKFVTAIHGKRNHDIVDGELEYRISFIPADLVPIDLSIEEEDDEVVPAGGLADDSDAESECMMLPSGTQGETSSEVPLSPTKKRNFKPFHPDQPEKLWILKTFLQVGCPLLVEDYEASFKDPREFMKARRKAKAANIVKSKKSKGKGDEVASQHTLMAFAKVTKPDLEHRRSVGLRTLPLPQTDIRFNARQSHDTMQCEQREGKKPSAFRLPATQIPEDVLHKPAQTQARTINTFVISPGKPKSAQPSELDNTQRPLAAMEAPQLLPQKVPSAQLQRTPKGSKKRPSPDLISPAMSQKTITSFYSPSPRKALRDKDIIDLVSSSPTQERPTTRPLTPTQPHNRFQFRHDENHAVGEDITGDLPSTVTKRRRKEPWRRWQTEPALTASMADEEGTERVLPQMTLAWERDVSSRTASMSGPGDLLIDLERMPHASRTDLYSVASDKGIGGTTFETTEAGETNSSLQDVEVHASDSTPLPKSLENMPTEKYSSIACLLLRQSPTRSTAPVSSSQPTRRSPRHTIVKKRIELRESLEGWWREVDVETVDLSGDGGERKDSGGKATITANSSSQSWRKSGVEILDLTGDK